MINTVQNGIKHKSILEVFLIFSLVFVSISAVLRFLYFNEYSGGFTIVFNDFFQLFYAVTEIAGVVLLFLYVRGNGYKNRILLPIAFGVMFLSNFVDISVDFDFYFSELTTGDLAIMLYRLLYIGTTALYATIAVLLLCGRNAKICIIIAACLMLFDILNTEIAYNSIVNFIKLGMSNDRVAFLLTLRLGFLCLYLALLIFAINNNPVIKVTAKTAYYPYQNVPNGYAPAMQYGQAAAQYNQNMYAQPVQPVYTQPATQYAQPMYAQPNTQYGQPMYAQPATQYTQPMYTQPAAQYVQPTDTNIVAKEPSSNEQLLKLLEEQKNQGIITEEYYTQKRNEILGNL